MDAVTLSYWLSKFVMEVAKKSGEICGIRRYQCQLNQIIFRSFLELLITFVELLTIKLLKNAH